MSGKSRDIRHYKMLLGFFMIFSLTSYLPQNSTLIFFQHPGSIIVFYCITIIEASPFLFRFRNHLRSTKLMISIIQSIINTRLPCSLRRPDFKFFPVQVHLWQLSERQRWKPFCNQPRGPQLGAKNAILRRRFILPSITTMSEIVPA